MTEYIIIEKNISTGINKDSEINQYVEKGCDIVSFQSSVNKTLIKGSKNHMSWFGDNDPDYYHTTNTVTLLLKCNKGTTNNIIL